MVNGKKAALPVLQYPSDQCLLIQTKEQLPTSISQECYLAAYIYEEKAQDMLLALEDRLKDRLLVPEVWKNILQRAGILISSSISGGTLRERLHEASEALPGRCWLYLEHLRMRFLLPCPSGTGTEICQDELNRIIAGKTVFYTPELCFQYCFEPTGSIILYDTRDTWIKKIHLAQEAGFCGVIRPYDPHQTVTAEYP